MLQVLVSPLSFLKTITENKKLRVFGLVVSGGAIGQIMVYFFGFSGLFCFILGFFFCLFALSSRKPSS